MFAHSYCTLSEVDTQYNQNFWFSPPIEQTKERFDKVPRFVCARHCSALASSGEVERVKQHCNRKCKHLSGRVFSKSPNITHVTLKTEKGGDPFITDS